MFNSGHRELLDGAIDQVVEGRGLGLSLFVVAHLVTAISIDGDAQLDGLVRSSVESSLERSTSRATRDVQFVMLQQSATW